MRRAVLFAVVVVAALAQTQPAWAAGTPPTGFTGVALDGKVDLNWQPMAGASAYTVYRGTSATAINTQITPTGGVALPGFTDTTAGNGTTYYYAVRSVVAGVESSNSLTLQATPRARSCSTGNPVVLENCYPGSSWTLTNPLTTRGIEGFLTAQSINKGDSVGVKVNTDSNTTFRIEIYRTGYYSGSGARLFSTIMGVPTGPQPACSGPDATTGLLDCSNWSTNATITTTASWPSGVYVLRIVRADNSADNHLLLVVRDDARKSDILYGVGFSTFEAYNAYGGKSLYDYNSGGAVTVAGTARAVKVSFDRPFGESLTTEPNWYTRDEHQMVWWLEQEGYDVSYISDTDLETNPGQVTNHKAYVMAAHDEYWSAAMRNALQQGRDAGVGIFDTGANGIYWKIRFENGPNGGQNRIEVCYKSTQSGGADPSGIPTGTWRDPAGANNPENALLGVMYVGDNDATQYPLVVPAADGAKPAWRYTGLDAQAPGTSTSIQTSIVGWEWDARVANGAEPAGVTQLADSPATGELIQNYGKNYVNGSATVQTTRYVAPSGALVFATGTNQWDWGLARTTAGTGQPDVRIQQVTANAFSDMHVLPQTPDSSLTVDDPTGATIAAPTGVTATAGGPDSIAISWSPVAGATGYDVYRSNATRNGGVPVGTRVNGTSSVTTTSFTDYGLNSGATYYYVVTAVKGGIHSPQSAQVQATTTASGSGTTVRINTGGPAYTSPSSGRVFSADTSFSGGATYSTAQPIAGTLDQPLYQNERWGQFTYSIAVANGTYDVRFHFVEMYYGSVVPGSCVGKRIFGMDILNTPASPDIANLDVCAQAGGPLTALIKTVSGVQVSNGVLTIQSVYGSVDDPEVAAIEVIPSGPAGPPTVTSTSPANGATGVSASTKVTATFSRSMDSTTITSSSFTLTPSGGSPVSATVSYDGTTNTATLTPSAALSYSTTYTAKLATTIKSADGQALASPVSWSFTTGPPPPPTVTSTSPVAGATGVATSAVVKATFSRAMDPTTITSSSFTLSPTTGPAVGATVSYDSTTNTATLTPSSALTTGTNYTATITTAARASDGTPLASAFTWTFTTVTAPTVTSTSPASGATGVSVSAKVTATFSRAMDPTTITTSTFTLNGPFGGVTATVAYDSTTNTATLTPSAALSYSTGYTASLAATIKAADGTPLGNAVSWSFTTGPPSSPTVTSTSPAAGATGVATGSVVKATFSRAMDPTTITSSSFTLTPSGGSPVAATVSYDSTTNTATLTPSAALATGTSYTATITTAATASDGTPLASPYSWSFTTVSAPTVTSTSPASGATGVSVSAKVTATFSRAMDPTTITNSSFTLTPTGGSPVAATVSYDSGTNTATLTPSASLAFSTTYTAMLAATIKAADGTPLANTVSWSFTTAATSSSPPTVTATSPASGATGVLATAKVTATFSRAMDATTITSSSFTVAAGGGTPVAAAVTYDGATNTATLTPQTPLLFSTSYTATLAATIKAADGTPLATAVTWSFITQAGTTIRINPGGGAYTSGSGATFLADTDFTGGSTYATSSTISGTNDPPLFQNERWGQFTYNIPVTNGVYDVKLEFVELYYGTSVPGSCVGKRIFGMDIVNTSTSPDIANLDICAQAGGPNTALIKTIGGVAVTNGTLSIQSVYGSVDDPEIAAIEVIPSSAPPPPPGPPTVTAKSPADGATGVTTGTTVTATFSRSMDATTITSSSFTLKAPDGSTVPASVTYNGTSNVATLTPSAALANSSTYTATLATTIKASDGQALASAVSWSFTTESAIGSGTTTIRINAGGGGYTSPSTGIGYLADTDFTGGSTYATTSTISGTTDPALFQNERWGQFTYNIPVTNGTYTVKFDFVELYYGTSVPGSCVGKRIFGMDILNTPTSPDIANLDICAQAGGPNTALVKTVTGVQVTNGTLSIQSVYGSVDDPEVAAIEVTPG